MKFAVNYSPPLAELVRAGEVAVDLFKCPAWPDLLAEAGKTLPVYVHFPISIGYGSGALNDERKQPLDLDWLAEMQAATGTPWINTHWIAPSTNYPAIPVDSRDPRHARALLDGALRDLEPLIRRFGAENVLVENVINERGWLALSVMPETIQRLLEESGCGFLFDISHARLSAANLGAEPRAFCAAMPVHRLREVHITGLQKLEGALLEQVIAVGDPYHFVGSFTGKAIDHLPMTDTDWPELEWAAGEIRAGRWSEPWVVSFEYGGVGKFWDEMTSVDVYRAQLPKMAGIIHHR